MNKIVKAILLVMCVGLLLGCLIIGVMICFVAPRQYMTTNLDDYGKYIGNYDNRSVQSFITSFFPAEISNSFSDVTYSYRAQKNDTYGFEAYLEFTITDAAQYASFIENTTAGMEEKAFQYDDQFVEYCIQDKYILTNSDGSSSSISEAKIGKILCSEEDQRIIFVALGVYDGGMTDTNFLCVYFNRFNINPVTYQRNSVTSPS